MRAKTGLRPMLHAHPYTPYRKHALDGKNKQQHEAFFGSGGSIDIPLTQGDKVIPEMPPLCIFAESEESNPRAGEKQQTGPSKGWCCPDDACSPRPPPAGTEPTRFSQACGVVRQPNY